MEIPERESNLIIEALRGGENGLDALAHLLWYAHPMPGVPGAPGWQALEDEYAVPFREQARVLSELVFPHVRAKVLMDSIEPVAGFVVERVRRDLDRRKGMWPGDIDEETEGEIMAGWGDIVRTAITRLAGIQTQHAESSIIYDRNPEADEIAARRWLAWIGAQVEIAKPSSRDNDQDSRWRVFLEGMRHHEVLGATIPQAVELLRSRVQALDLQLVIDHHLQVAAGVAEPPNVAKHRAEVWNMQHPYPRYGLRPAHLPPLEPRQPSEQPVTMGDL